jgi:hypothetical protein
MQSVTAFKIFCLPLSIGKQEKLKLMINEYAEFYNYSARTKSEEKTTINEMLSQSEF